MPGRMVLFIDGASRGNPGPAAIGVLICDGRAQPQRRMGQYLGETTNNVAEYTALVYGLQEALMARASEIEVRTDSELLVKQFNRQYKVKDEELKRLYEQVLHLKRGFAKVELIHIPREKNKEADRLANKALGNRRKEGPAQPPRPPESDLFAGL